MVNIMKTTILILLAFLTLSFSGLTLRKAEAGLFSKAFECQGKVQAQDSDFVLNFSGLMKRFGGIVSGTASFFYKDSEGVRQAGLMRCEKFEKNIIECTPLVADQNIKMIVMGYHGAFPVLHDNSPQSFMSCGLID
jgi:hypothetical protein